MQTPPPTLPAVNGGSVQQGLSAAYELFAFCLHRLAAHKRYSLGLTATTMALTMQKSSDPPDQEPPCATSAVEAPQTKPRTGRKSTASLRRELSDKDMTNAAVAKLLLDDVERLEQQINELGNVQGRYHEADKRAAVLEQKLNVSRSQEIVFAVCTTLAGAALGFAPSAWSETNATGPIVLSAGVVLLICALIAKAVKS